MLRYLRFAREMWASEVNSAVVDSISPMSTETVMDIGAGVGAATMVAIESGCRVMAIEPTPYMRRVLALRLMAARASDQVEVVDGTAEATTVASASIDAAWAVNTMHHWSDLTAGIAELARVLTPGGRLLLVDEDFDDPAHPDFERFSARRSDEHAHHFHTVDPDAVAAAMAESGLAVGSAGRDHLAGRPAIVIRGSASPE